MPQDRTEKDQARRKETLQRKEEIRANLEVEIAQGEHKEFQAEVQRAQKERKSTQSLASKRNTELTIARQKTESFQELKARLKKEGKLYGR